MPKNRKSSAHNYKMQAKNEVLINYRQEHIKAYNRNQKFTRHILLYSLLSMIYFPILCVLYASRLLLLQSHFRYVRKRKLGRAVPEEYGEVSVSNK